MDGIRAGEIIRDQYRIPIIYVTAMSDEAMGEHQHVLSDGYCLHKPFIGSELRAVVHAALHDRFSLDN